MDLPPAATRHLQVRRLQPGDALRLFDGQGAEHEAQVLSMGRSQVKVRVGAALPVQHAPGPAVHLALCMPANERMDALVEKATELGAASLQPLLSERSVLRLAGERARKRCEHWRAVAVSASEQCGRSVVPIVGEVQQLDEHLATLHESAPAGAPTQRLLLSLAPEAAPLAQQVPQATAASLPQTWWLLSGPEGGLAPAEEAAAKAAGYVPVSLGARVLRADTAPLAALAWLTLVSAAAPSG